MAGSKHSAQWTRACQKQVACHSDSASCIGVVRGRRTEQERLLAGVNDDYAA